MEFIFDFFLAASFEKLRNSHPRTFWIIHVLCFAILVGIFVLAFGLSR